MFLFYKIKVLGKPLVRSKFKLCIITELLTANLPPLLLPPYPTTSFYYPLALILPVNLLSYLMSVLPSPRELLLKTHHLKHETCKVFYSEKSGEKPSKSSQNN